MAGVAERLISEMNRQRLEDEQSRLGAAALRRPAFIFPEDSLVAVADVTKRVNEPVRPMGLTPATLQQASPYYGLSVEAEKIKQAEGFTQTPDLLSGAVLPSPEKEFEPEPPSATEFGLAKLQGRTSVGEFEVPEDFPNILQRQKKLGGKTGYFGRNRRFTGKAAGILARFVEPIGQVLDAVPFLDVVEMPPIESIRLETEKSEVGEVLGSVAGEIVKYSLLGRAIGGFGIGGFYKWGGAGAVSGFSRELYEGKGVLDALSSPDVYIEASLAGSPFILKSAWGQGARFLRNYTKRPVNEIPGFKFYRDGKLTRLGETSPDFGRLYDASGKELRPLDVLIPESPALKWFKQAKAGLPEMERKFAEFVNNSAAASGFLASLNEDLIVGMKAAKSAKEHMFGATKFLWQAQNRGKTPEFKTMMKSIQETMELEHLYSGLYLERLREIGITKWNGLRKIPGTNLRNDGKALAALLERDNFHVREFRQWLTDIHAFAESKGIDVSGYRASYFPRILNTKVAKKLRDDMNTLLSGVEAGTGLEAFGLHMVPDEVKRLSEIAKVWVNADKTSKRPLAEALKKIVGDPKSGIDNYGDAFYYLRQQVYDDLFSPMGNLERPRRLALPDSFYERDAKNVLVRYMRGVAKRAAIVETFGKNGKKASDLLKQMAFKNKEEADIAKQILDSYTGRININKGLKGKSGRVVQSIIDGSMNFEVATKIGFGTATIPNITQILISSLSKAGVKKTILGGFDLLKAENRKRLRQSGILLDSAQDAILGFTHDDGWRKFVDLTLEASGFAGINRINQYWSGAIGRRYIQDLYRISQRKIDEVKPEGLVETLITATIPRLDIGRIKWAQRKLNDLGIDWRRPLSSDIESRGMWRFANETQLQRNVLREPLLANDPRLRWMFLFKKFGLKQAQLIKETVVDELFKEGNVFPMLRLGAAGYLGGEFVVFSKNKLSEIVSGLPYYREPESNVWERMIENYASVGGFGVMGDLGATLMENVLFDPDFQKEDVSAITRNLKFYTLPVQAQTVADVWDFFSEGAGARYLAEIDDPVAFQEAMADAMKLFGTISRRLSKRLEAPGQLQRRRVSRRNRILSELRDLARMAETADNPEKGQSLWKLLYDRANAWNTANPELWIDVDKMFTEEEVGKLLLREEKKKEEREFPKPLNF